MCKALVTLCERNLGSTDVLNEVMGAQSGNKYLVKAAVLHSNFWKGRHQELLSADSVHKHLQPGIDKALTTLKDACAAKDAEAMVIGLEDTSKQLGLWRNRMRAGSTKNIEAVICDTFASVHSTMEGGEVPDTVMARSVQVAEIVSKSLVTDNLKSMGVSNELYCNAAKDLRVLSEKIVKQKSTQALESAATDFSGIARTIAKSEVKHLYSSHDKRMAAYSALSSASSQCCMKTLSEELQSLLADSYSWLLSALSRLLLEANTLASSADLEAECGRFFAEMSVLQSLGNKLGGDLELKHMGSILPYFELCHAMRDLQTKMSPVTPATKRSAIQLITRIQEAVQIKSDEYLDKDCLAQLAALKCAGEALRDKASSVIEMQLQDSLKDMTKALCTAITSEWLEAENRCCIFLEGCDERREGPE